MTAQEIISNCDIFVKSIAKRSGGQTMWDVVTGAKHYLIDLVANGKVACGIEYSTGISVLSPSVEDVLECLILIMDYDSHLQFNGDAEALRQYFGLCCIYHAQAHIEEIRKVWECFQHLGFTPDAIDTLRAYFNGEAE